MLNKEKLTIATVGLGIIAIALLGRQEQQDPILTPTPTPFFILRTVCLPAKSFEEHQKCFQIKMRIPPTPTPELRNL